MRLLAALLVVASATAWADEAGGGAVGPTGRVALGVSAYSGAALQLQAGWRIAPWISANVQGGLYLFATELIGKSSDGIARSSTVSTRFATAGATAWPVPWAVVGLHVGAVRLAELLTDSSGTAEISSVTIPAINVSVGWQFFRRPWYRLGLELQGWACFSDRHGFLMDGNLLFAAQFR